MTYLINLLLVPLYYLILRLVLPRQKANHAFWWIVAVHAILFRALANPYNYVDTGNYAEAFRNIGHVSFKAAVIDTNRYSDWGRGYVLYNWFISRITTDTKAFFVITSVIAVGGIMLYYKKTAYTALAPILLYLTYPMMYVMGFGVLRQHLSIPFLLFALYYIERPKISLSLALLATSLHTAGIAFFPFYLLYRLLKRLSSGEVLILALSLLVIIRIFATFVLSQSARYGSYLQAKSDNNTLPVLMTGLLIVLLYEGQVFNKARTITDRNILRFLLYGFALSVFSIGTPYGGRLSLPVIYILPAAMTLLYRYGSKNKDEYYLGLAYIFTLVVLSQFLNMQDEHNQLKYTFFWE